MSVEYVSVELSKLIDKCLDQSEHVVLVGGNILKFQMHPRKIYKKNN